MFNSRSNQFQVYGFLPFWTLNMVDTTDLKSLTHLIYFGIEISSDGTLKSNLNKKELEPGWVQLNSASLKKLRTNFPNRSIIVVRNMNSQNIESILNNRQAFELSIEQIINLVKVNKYQGVNIDFESSDSFSPETQTNFTKWISKLVDVCHSQVKHCEVSIDINADSAAKDRLYQLKPLGLIADRIIVMAYDFYYRNSTKSGPVAPLTGKCKTPEQINCLDYDIKTAISDISRSVSPHKLILGIPTYGYLWTTTDDSFLSNTTSRGVFISQRDIAALFNSDSPPIASWSAHTLTPYAIIREKKVVKQIHYENSQSIQEKIRFAQANGLAGIAYWAIGYQEQSFLPLLP